MTKEIIYMTIDGGSEYIAIYVDGKLRDYSDSYNFGLEEGFKLARDYPGYTLKRVYADEDWLDTVYYEAPELLSDVVYLDR